jgi:hypothetical protein
MVSRQPKRSQAEQKKMMRDNALYNGPWYYSHEKNTLVNGSEVVEEAARNAAAEFEKPPKEFLLFNILPLGKNQFP